MYMSSKNMNMAKGIGLGIAVGTAAAIAGTKMMTRKGRKMCRKNAAKCMRTVEDMLSSMSMM